MKGLIFSPEKGIYLLFAYNPAEMEFTKEIIYQEHIGPGQEIPFYSFIRGGKQIIKFELTIDIYKPKETGIYLIKTKFEEKLGIMPELAKIEELSQITQRFALKGKRIPPVCYFSFGPYINYEVIFTATYKITEFAKNLIPISAVCDVELIVIKDLALYNTGKVMRKLFAGLRI